MNRDRIMLLLGVLGVALGVWWVVANTEWVDVDSPRQAQGEARTNPVYAFEQLLRKLGGQVEHHEALQSLPPHKARLVLLSSDWELVPGRAEQLHQWVLQGGHLVLLQSSDWDTTDLANWVPAFAVEVPRKPVAPAGAASDALAKARAKLEGSDGTELTSSTPLWGSVDKLRSCNFIQAWRRLMPKVGHEPEWTLGRNNIGNDVLRMPVGQGSVTVFNAYAAIFYNEPVLECDHALLLAAVVQAEPGATTWIYLNEKREALIPWLWHKGWIAIVAGLLAVAAALWRGATRFGPRLAPPPRLRRSIAEQVRGLGTYLQREGREALLLAQQRALEDAAARHLPGYRRLTIPQRGSAIAAATGLNAEALTAVLQVKTVTRAELPVRLELLETARRALLS